MERIDLNSLNEDCVILVGEKFTYKGENLTTAEAINDSFYDGCYGCCFEENGICPKCDCCDIIFVEDKTK